MARGTGKNIHRNSTRPKYDKRPFVQSRAIGYKALGETKGLSEYEKKLYKLGVY